MIYKTSYIKLKIEKKEPHLKLGGEFRSFGRVSSSCSICSIRHNNVVPIIIWGGDIHGHLQLPSQSVPIIIKVASLKNLIPAKK